MSETPGKVRKKTTATPINPVKADLWNFNDLVRDLAYCVYWKNLKRRKGRDPMPVWTIDYTDTLEYTAPLPDDPTTLTIVEAKRSIQLNGVQYHEALEHEKLTDHRQHIEAYLSRKPRAVKPSERWAKWLLWTLADDQLEATNRKREANGSQPLSDQERADLITRIQRELRRKRRLTRHSDHNTGFVRGTWEKMPMFVEPPDLMHSDYTAQMLAWRQLLYLLMPYCSCEVHTRQRPLNEAVQEGIHVE